MDGLLLSNQLVASLGFFVIDATMIGFGYSRLTASRDMHEVFTNLLQIGGLGALAMGAWLTLTFNWRSGIVCVVLFVIWTSVFGGLRRLTRKDAPDGGSNQ